VLAVGGVDLRERLPDRDELDTGTGERRDPKCELLGMKRRRLVDDNEQRRVERAVRADEAVVDLGDEVVEQPPNHRTEALLVGERDSDVERVRTGQQPLRGDGRCDSRLRDDGIDHGQITVRAVV
jgi:hypothetical protein